MSSREIAVIAVLGAMSLGMADATPSTGGAAPPDTQAVGEAQFVRDLQIYAAFAKLEANIAEASAAAILSVLRSDSEARALLAREYYDDVLSIEQYVRLIESYELTGEQQEAIEAFKEVWTPLAEEGNALVASSEDADALVSDTFDWWNRVQDVDDTVDIALDALLETYGASIEAEVGRYEEVGGEGGESEEDEGGE
jgi:hypothetical protein